MKELNRMQYIRSGSDVVVLPLLSAVLHRQSRWFQGSSVPGYLTISPSPFTPLLQDNNCSFLLLGKSCFLSFKNMGRNQNS